MNAAEGGGINDNGAAPNRCSRQRWIDELRRTKLEHTLRKVAQGVRGGIDDYGLIPWTDPIPYEHRPNHPSGICHGMRAASDAYARWLDAIPSYVHPASALAGGWFSPDGRLACGWPPEERPRHLQPLVEKYSIYMTGVGGMNHFGPDMTIGLSLGWGGLLEKVRRCRAINRPRDTSFYDGEETVVLAIQRWIGRHAVLARTMAEREADPARAVNLRDIAAMNERLVVEAPATLREACQFLAWFQCADRMWFLGGALGQLDELLRPFYEADRERGGLDDEDAVWFLASLFFNDTHYSQIGGEAPDGTDLTSPLSFIILEAAHRLRIPVNLAVRVHEGMDHRLLERSVRHLLEDGSGASYSCARGIVEGFMRNGFPRGLARMRAKVGCNWTSLPGIEYAIQDVTRICLVTPFLRAFEEIVAGDPALRTMERLWERYEHHLGIVVGVIKEGYDWHFEHHARHVPEIILNLFCHGPLERGLDVSTGGVDIYYLNCDGLGLATVADSFAAVETRVVREGKLSWTELAGHLARDFEGAEDVRLMLRGIPRFGCGDSAADRWAKRISQAYARLVAGTPTPAGYHLIPGLFSHINVDAYGQNMPATPNGRRRGTAISHGANPDFGFLPGGSTALTAKASAVAAVQPGYGNSAPLQIEIDRDAFGDEDGVEKLAAFIRTHEAQGGTLVNVNVLSSRQIVEAARDPSLHPDLIVRVTGFSAYFSMLSPYYRQWVVDRVLQRDGTAAAGPSAADA